MTEPEDKPGKPTILVVEDEILLRADLTDELRDQGYAVVEAADSNEALSVLRGDAEVDLLVTDVRMPRGTMDGIALARWARSKHPAIKVVLTSGHIAEADGSELFDGFFPKPCEIAKLIAHIESLLMRRAATALPRW